MKINENIKYYRDKKDMSQEKLGELIGVPKQTISKYEIGEVKNIPYDKVELIAEILDVQPAILMGWNNSPAPAFEFSDTDYEFLEKLHMLNERQRQFIMDSIDLILEGVKNEKN